MLEEGEVVVVVVAKCVEREGGREEREKREGGRVV